MPRFQCETNAVDPVLLDDAVGLAALRFPEIAVEHQEIAAGGTESRTLWVCRAPSRAHLDRWAEAAQLALLSIRQLNGDARLVDPDRTPSPGSGANQKEAI